MQLGTIALVRPLTRALDVPVVAAGGLMDGAGIAAARNSKRPAKMIRKQTRRSSKEALSHSPGLPRPMCVNRNKE
ncbi:MAG: hypothetical protein KGH75_01750 [Rhodospirillales bacterium]|nr:hypothetical protein [Rhodospirillales bacterium]